MKFMKLNLQLFASGTIEFPYSGNLQGKIVWSSVSNGSTANSSNVTATLYARKNITQATVGPSWVAKIEIAGETSTKSSYNPSITVGNSWREMYSFTKTVSHNSDGTANIYIGGSIKGPSGTSLSSRTSSGGSNVSLDTIPRASSFTATNADVEDFTYIHINRASNTFKHRLTFTIGNYSEVSNDVGDNLSYKFLPVWYSHISGRWATCTIKCETFNGNDKIGEVSQNITVYCNEERCKPDATVTIIDTNTNTTSLTGDSSKLVKNKSTAKITVTATPKNNATISSVTIDGVNGIVREIPNISKNTFNIVVTDSRGFPRILTPTTTIIEYVPLTMSPDIKRVTQTGQKVKIKVTGNYFNSTFGSKSNTLTMSWSYRQKGSSDWITGGNIIPTKTNNKYEYEITTGDLFNYQKNYEFIIYASDKLTSINSGAITLAKGQGSLEVYKDGIKLNGVFLAVEIVDEW